MPRRVSSPRRSPGSSRRASGAEVGVFYRTNAQSRVLEDVLVRQSVAYQVIGGPRHERAEVKDVISYLQVIDNPYDAVSLQRIANKPRRGMATRRSRAPSDLRERARDLLWEALEFAEEAGSRSAALAVRSFRTMVQSLMSGALELTVPELVERVLQRSGYLDALEAERTIESQGRIENLQELVGVAQEYHASAPEPNLSSFLQEISLYSDQDAIRGEQSLVTLMTLHNAKGLEFRAVFMIGMEEGIFPHSRALEEAGLEEERRLAYVGMTRARERLTMTHASARSLWGARPTTCRPASSTSFPRRASSANGCARPRGRATTLQAGSRRAETTRISRPATPCCTGLSARAS